MDDLTEGNTSDDLKLGVNKLLIKLPVLFRGSTTNIEAASPSADTPVEATSPRADKADDATSPTADDTCSKADFEGTAWYEGARLAMFALCNCCCALR